VDGNGTEQAWMPNAGGGQGPGLPFYFCRRAPSPRFDQCRLGSVLSVFQPDMFAFSQVWWFRGTWRLGDFAIGSNRPRTSRPVPLNRCADLSRRHFV